MFDETNRRIPDGHMRFSIEGGRQALEIFAWHVQIEVDRLRRTVIRVPQASVDRVRTLLKGEKTVIIEARYPSIWTQRPESTIAQGFDSLKINATRTLFGHKGFSIKPHKPYKAPRR